MDRQQADRLLHGVAEDTAERALHVLASCGEGLGHMRVVDGRRDRIWQRQRHDHRQPQRRHQQAPRKPRHRAEYLARSGLRDLAGRKIGQATDRHAVDQIGHEPDPGEADGLGEGVGQPGRADQPIRDRGVEQQPVNRASSNPRSCTRPQSMPLRMSSRT